MLKSKIPSMNDQEGSTVPTGLHPVIDAHVHIFPGSIFSAIRKWFDRNAWQIRYQLTSTEIFEFLLSHGVKHIIALQYAHKPGIARQLNQYMAEKCSEYSHRVTGMTTVFPGEDNAENILQEAFDSSLKGVKRNNTINGEKYFSNFIVEIRDEDHDLVARVKKKIYVRRKQHALKN